MYTFHSLSYPIERSTFENNWLFDNEAGVLGVEMTIPEFASRCNLGNIDPQHSDGLNVAACVAALDIPLPPDGATLVTARPDADSLTAMAVIKLRKDGIPFDEAKVRLIGAADSAQAGPWRRDYTTPDEFNQVSQMAMEYLLSLSRRVERIGEWLMGEGTLPPVFRYFPIPTPENRGAYAIVSADGLAARGGCGAGYKVAPIVILRNARFTSQGEDPHLKYTIARWNSAVRMDWEGMMEKLRALEPGWGGSTSICGSTPGIASPLTLDQVIDIVEGSIRDHIQWEITGRHGYDYDSVICTYPSCGFNAQRDDEMSNEQFVAWVDEHKALHH